MSVKESGNKVLGTSEMIFGGGAAIGASILAPNMAVSFVTDFARFFFSPILRWNYMQSSGGLLSYGEAILGDGFKWVYDYANSFVYNSEHYKGLGFVVSAAFLGGLVMVLDGKKRSSSED